MRELLVRAFIQKEGLAIENIYFLNYLEDDLKDKLSQLIDVIDDFLNNQPKINVIRPEFSTNWYPEDE